MPQYIKLAYSNPAPVVTEDRGANCPEAMFASFLPDVELDIGGMRSANRFRRLFFGENILFRFLHLVLHLLGIRERSLSREDLILLIHKHGKTTCQEAGGFIKQILGQKICYASRKEIQHVVINKQGVWIEKEKKKYFTLQKQVWGDWYYLVLTDD